MLDLSKQASWLGLFLTQMSHVAAQDNVPQGSQSIHGVNHLNVPPVEWVNFGTSLDYVGKVDDVEVDFTQTTINTGENNAAEDWKFDCGTVATPLYYGHTLEHRKHINFTGVDVHNVENDKDEDLHPKISFSANADIKKINVHMHDLYLENRISNNTAAHHGYQNYTHSGSRLSHQPIDYWQATYDVAEGATTIANTEAASVETKQYIKVCPMRNTTHTYQINVTALEDNGTQVWSKLVQVQYKRPLTHGAAAIILHNRQQIHHHQQIKAKKMIQTDKQQTLVM